MNLFLKAYNRILRYSFLQKWTLHCKASNGFFFLSLKGVIMAFLWKENKCIHLTKILRINRKTHLWQMVRRAQYIYLDIKLLAFLACFAEVVYGPFGQSTMQPTLDFQFSAHASHERIECTLWEETY